MARRQRPTPEQRIAEYVDSPMMTQRIRFGKQISAQILGNYGVYRTQAGQGKKVTGECTCPSDWWPCKHVHALRETWKANPHSFFDLDQFFAELFEQPKATLIEAIEQMIVASPEMLQFFGVPGFEDDDDEEDEYGEEDDWDE
jgi:hypothetical protein